MVAAPPEPSFKQSGNASAGVDSPDLLDVIEAMEIIQTALRGEIAELNEELCEGRGRDRREVEDLSREVAELRDDHGRRRLEVDELRVKVGELEGLRQTLVG